MSKVSEAVAALDALDGGDPERAHGDADGILRANVDPRIAAAYQRLMDRCEWWAWA